MQAKRHGQSGTGTEPRDDLDVAYSIIRPSEYDDLLEQINFGTGYYDDNDLAMQMRNVRKGFVTDIAFSETLRKRAIQETKVKLADEGFSWYDEQADRLKQWDPLTERDVGVRGRTTKLFKRGEKIWSELDDPQYALSVEQAAAIHEKTGFDVFKPIFSMLAAAYHDTTKSKGGRTQDNYFGRVRRHETPNMNEAEKSHFLGRGRSN